MSNFSIPLVGRARHAAILMLAASLTVVASACGDDSTEPEDATIVGVWNATSFDVLGDFIDEGLSVTVTITGTESAGSISIAFQNDVDEVFCEDGGPNCTQSGTYTATASQILVAIGDNQDDEPVPFNYVITGDGDTMTWSGTVEGIPATITLERA